MENEQMFVRVMPRLIFLSMVGMVLAWTISGPWGLWLSTDSVFYWQAAQNFILGKGFSVFDKAGVLQPITHYPVMYPFLLSWSWILGSDVFIWARGINAFLFGLNIFLTGLLTWVLLREVKAMMVAAAFFFVSVPILEVHLRMLSEPLFFTWMLAGFTAFFLYTESSSRRWLYISAIFVGLSALTRFTGMALLIVLFTVLVCDRNKASREKFKDAGIFLLLSVVLPFLWLARNQIVSGHVVVQNIGWHGIDLVWLQDLIDHVSQWALPSRVPKLFRWIVMGSVIGVTLAVFRKQRKILTNAGRQSSLGVIALVAYVVAFVPILIVTRAFFDPSLAMDHRILSSVYVLLAVLAGYVFSSRCPASYVRLLRGMVILFGVILFVRSTYLAVNFFKKGAGYSARAAVESRTVRELQALDDRVKVYTNDTEFMYYLIRRSSLRVPVTLQEAQRLPSVVQAGDEFRSRQAIAVIFKGSASDSFWWQALEKEAGLNEVISDQVATIYAAPKESRLNASR